MEGELYLVTNEVLTWLGGLDQLEEVTGSLYIANLPLLDKDLDLGLLTTVGGTVQVYNNDLITDLDLGALTGTGSSVAIYNNDSIGTVDVSSLVEVEGSFQVYNVPDMTSLDASSLTLVEGALQIYGNDRWESELDLGALTTVDSYLYLVDNALLPSFDLDALSSLGGDLYIQSNPVLPECLAEELADRLSAAGAIGGTAYISGNDSSASCP